MVVLGGRVLTHEVTAFDTGSQVVRYTITVRVEEPRPRVDVIQVNLWVREGDEEPYLPDRGERVLVVGSVQRRFWQAPDGRRSKMEIHADEVARWVRNGPRSAWWSSAPGCRMEARKNDHLDFGCPRPQRGSWTHGHMVRLLGQSSTPARVPEMSVREAVFRH